MKLDQARTAKLTQEVSFSGDRTLYLYPSAAGINSYGTEKWSSYAADALHRIVLHADDTPPGIRIRIGDGDPMPLEDFDGLMLGEGGIIDRREEGSVTLILDAEDPSSGIKTLMLRVINTDTGEEGVYGVNGERLALELKLSHDLGEFSFENALFNGNFYLEAVCEDTVGNVATARSASSVELDIKAGIRRYLDDVDDLNEGRIAAGERLLFRKGESGLLSASVWGYPDYVLLEFPEEMGEYSALYVFGGEIPSGVHAENIFHLSDPAYMKDFEADFMIPLEYSEDSITLRVLAGKNGETVSWEERASFAVEGSILDELRSVLG